TERVPGVFLALFDTQGDTATLFVDIENHDFHFIADIDDLRRVDVLVGPIHFGNVHQTFHALFQLGNTAAVSEVGDLGLDPAALRRAAGDFNPRIRTQLLQAGRSAIALSVEREDFDVDLVANVDDFARVLDALPRHIGDVQQA